jgi:hypothetical protein
MALSAQSSPNDIDLLYAIELQEFELNYLFLHKVLIII